MCVAVYSIITCLRARANGKGPSNALLLVHCNCLLSIVGKNCEIRRLAECFFFIGVMELFSGSDQRSLGLQVTVLRCHPEQAKRRSLNGRSCTTQIPSSRFILIGFMVLPLGKSHKA
jgi:hypothetical protein